MGWWENLQLKVGGVDARVRAMEQMGASGDPRQVDSIAAAALEDGSALVQKAAAEALGRIGAPAVAPLLAQLKDKDPDLRKLVTEILLKIGQPAVDAMAAGLADPNPDTRRLTADSLGKIGDPKAIPILGEALQDAYGSVREAVARAMDLLGWQPEGDAETALRAVALRDWKQAASLGPAAVPSLVAAIKDSERRLSESAADALTKVGPAAVPPLLEALKDENPIRRSQAARALGEINVPDAVPALLELLHDTDGTVRESAV